MTLGAWLREQTGWLPGGRTAASPLLADCTLFVLDVDATGTDPRKDKATGIAVLPVAHGEIRLAELRYYPLEPTADDPNWRENYRTLVDRLADQPVLTYNARGVKHLIKQAAQEHQLPLPFANWIDLASVLYGAFGHDGNEIGSMPHWLARMKLKTAPRHAAAADVFVLAQLLQTLLAYCDSVGIRTLADLRQSQNARAWLRS